MSEQFTNDAETTLNGAINNSVTSITVTSATGFPTSGEFRIRIDDEIMTVTGVSGTTWTVTRASENVAGSATAASHADLAVVKHVLTAGALQNLALPTGTIGCRVYATTTQSIADNTINVLVTFDAEEFDSDGFHSTSSNTSRLTVPTGLGGKYLIIGHVGFNNSGDADGRRRVQILKNGAAIRGSATEQGGSASSGLSTELICTAVLDLVPTDYIEIAVFQNSGASMNIGTVSDPSGTKSTLEFYKLDSGRVGTGIGAKALRSATTTLTTGVETLVAFALTDEFDTNGFHNPSSNNTRMTIPAGLSGYYLAVASVRFAANATGHRSITFSKNGGGGGSSNHGSRIGAGSATNSFIGQATMILYLTAGDYLEVYAMQSSGGDLDITDGQFSLMRIDSLPPTSQGLWQDYTPTWASDGTQPTIGNGTIFGRYKYLDQNTIAIKIKLTFGSTSTAGTGNRTLSLPSGITTKTGNFPQIVSARYLDSGTAHFAGIGYADGSSNVFLVMVGNNTSGTNNEIWSGTYPTTMATGDSVDIQGIIEIN